MLVPGIIENWIIIIDTAKKNSLDPHLNFLKSII